MSSAEAQESLSATSFETVFAFETIEDECTSTATAR